MAANPREIRAILQAIQGNPALVAQLREERDQLVLDTMLSSAGGREIVNGSGNGMAYTAQITMSKRERLAVLQAALDFYAAGQYPSSWARTRF